MRNHLLLLLLIFHFSVYGQETSLHSFDFWLGTWEASWDEGEGKLGKGINVIEKILDDKAIQENFSIIEGQNTGFKGKSMSVFNPRNGKWKQAWVDNQGGYFDFTGIIEDNRKIFQTEVQTLPNGSTRQQRMVFYNIEENKFTWDWELSQDRGNSWTLQWRINYQRKDK